jgi:alkanesulfonate monooxygenase SsuD/methylene tetrahydromethanopterin reductase-like flavin-dependent oxidoreductase (luciferase family)
VNQIDASAPRRQGIGISMRVSSVDASELPPNLVTDSAQQAERLGFDSLWCGDHLFWHHPRHEALVALTWALATTRKLTVGFAVMLLANRSPVVVAKEAATMAYLSRNRLIFGVGVGGEFAPEWIATGTPMEGRGKRTEEAVELVRHLWQGEAAQFGGDFYSVGEVRLQPVPTAPIPIFLGGRAPVALRRAGRVGDGWLGLWQTPERYASAVRIIDEEREAAGRLGMEFTNGLLLRCRVTDGSASSEQAAKELLARSYDMDPARVRRYVAAGSSAEIVDLASQFIAAGSRLIVLNPIATTGDHAEQVEQLGSEVLPQLRRVMSEQHGTIS